MSKSKNERRKRSLWMPITLLVVVFFFAVTLSDNLGMTLFNIVLGNDVNAVIIRYNSYSVYSYGETSMKFNFNFFLVQTRQPIETVLQRMKVSSTPNYQVDVTENDVFKLSFTATIFVGDVHNRKQLFSHTFTYADPSNREITIYLNDLNTAVYNEVFVEVSGSYELNGKTVPFEAGATLQVEG